MGMILLMIMRVSVHRAILVGMSVGVMRFVAMLLVLILRVMTSLLVMLMVMGMLVLHMHIELRAGNAGFLPATDVQVITIEREFLQFLGQLPGIHAQIDERPDEHVTADSAKNIEIKSLGGRVLFHDGFCASSLIWEAA